MSTRIRLRRLGANKRPYYRVVVADQRAPRDGRFIENIGKYHPLEDPSLIDIDEERALHWLRTGAQPSDQVRNLMVKTGIWARFVDERPSAAVPLRDRSAAAEQPKISKKAAAKAAAEAEAPAEAEVAVPGAPEPAPAEPAGVPAEQAAEPSEAPPADEVSEPASQPEEPPAEEPVEAADTADPIDESQDEG